MFKNIIIIFVVATFLAYAFLAVSFDKTSIKKSQSRANKAYQHEQLKAQAGCFDEKALRVKMGETLFALPRSIKNFKGPDEHLERKSIYTKKIKARHICQKPSDPPLELESLSIILNPEYSKPYSERCKNLSVENNCSRVYRGLLKRNSSTYKSKKICPQGKSCAVFCIVHCRHAVKYKNLTYEFQFNSGYDSEEELKLLDEHVQYLEKEILEKLKSYDITPPQEERQTQ